MEVRINRIDIIERDCIITGQAGYNQRLGFKVRDSEGEMLAFQVKKRVGTKNHAKFCAFEVIVPNVECQNFLLLVSADDKVSKHSISMISAGQRVQGSRLEDIQRAVLYVRQKGVKKMLGKVKGRLLLKEKAVDYGAWQKQHQPSMEELKQQKKIEFNKMPHISILVPLYHTPETYLREMVASVMAQTYPNWQLCLSDGGGPRSGLGQIGIELSRQDERIMYLPPEEQLSIAENTNRARKAAQGEWLGFLDHDDLLAPDALYECVAKMNGCPDTELIYTDEDKVTMDSSSYFEPHLKSDFNIDLLCSQNYICHFVVIKSELSERVGELNPVLNGAQDHDYLLRCASATSQISHIPKILYHWRAHQDSTAERPEGKEYAFAAGAKAVEEHYKRCQIPATVKQGKYPGQYITKYHWEEQPLVSVIIPNKDHQKDLEGCICSIEEKNSYPNLEYIIIENNSEEEKTFSYYNKLAAQNKRVRIIAYQGDFNYSKINNLGVSHARGELLLFLNNDTELINGDSISLMAGVCQRPEVGVVGAKLLYPDHTIQHAGVIIGMRGIAGHAFLGLDDYQPGYFSRAICTQNYSAVTAACMMTKKKVFQELGGFGEDFQVAFNDIDYCLRARDKGWLVVYEADAKLYHYESKSRGKENSRQKVERFRQEIELFEKCWSHLLKRGDPYYNPNLTLESEDFSLNKR